MLRIVEIDFSKLNQSEQMVLLNACLSASNHNYLSEAQDDLKGKLDEDIWFVYKGGHHIAIGKKGEEVNPALKLFELSDAYLSMLGFPEYLCNERLALGISLVGGGK